MKRVAVITGGRGHRPTPRELRELHEVLERYDITHVRCGGASGVDTDVYAHVRDIWEREEWPADWKKHGAAAGPLRNTAMLSTGDVVLVVAFSGGAGTADCVAQATKKGIAVHVIQFSVIEPPKKRSRKKAA